MPLAAQITVTPLRLAGLSPASWPIGDGGPATGALLSPSALAWDRAGNLLIADNRNQRIRRLMPDGTISTVFSQDGSVVSMAVDSKGNLYVSVLESLVPAQAHIFEFSPNGGRTEIPKPGLTYDAPGISIDGADNLYLTDNSDGGGFVWKRSPSGALQKIAGNGVGGIPTQGGPALEVNLDGPHALAFDRSGNLLIADWSGILRLNPDGNLVRLVLGEGPSRIAPAADGSIYFIGDVYGIWRWDPAGGLASFAGTPQSGFSDGCALSGGKRIAKYASIDAADLALDAAGRIYIADNSHDTSDPGWHYSFAAGRIRRIDPDGSIRTVAGSGFMPHESAPGGPALGAVFHDPEVLAVDGARNVFFAESGANHVHEIAAAGQFLTIAGTNSPPAGEDPACYPLTGTDVLSSPGGLAADANGNVFISDTGHHRILRRSGDGTITTIAGTGVDGETGDGGPAGQARISRPTAIAVRPDGSIYFVTQGAVRRIGPDGIIDSPPVPQVISWLTVGFDGRLVLNSSKLYREIADGSFDALRYGVVGAYGGGQIAVDPAGAIYGVSNPLVRISPNCNYADVTSPPGLISQPPQGVAADSDGNLYFSADNSVWRIAPITSSAADSPSIYLDSVGVFNAASNLTAPTTVPPPCLKQCGPYAMNDSITGNEILRITGGCMGSLVPSPASLVDGRLPTKLQDTQVLFDGEAAPLVSVQATEIRVIAPQDVASKSKVTLMVQNQSASASAVLNAAAAVPGIFVSSGTQAAAINEDGSLNGAGHPAPVGSVLALFLTGAGLTAPPALDGVPPGLPLPQLALPVTVTVGGAAAEVAYAGSVFGFPGLAQVNIRVPAVAASNAVPVQVVIGGNSRNQSVTIAIQ